MQNVDYTGDGTINYSEFLAATVQISQVLTNKRLIQLFKHFDIDNSQSITQQNIKEAFLKSGRQLTDQYIQQLMLCHDTDGDGVISFNEFQAIFSGSLEQENQRFSSTTETSETY